jgi:hypothetical protein
LKGGDNVKRKRSKRPPAKLAAFNKAARLFYLCLQYFCGFLMAGLLLAVLENFYRKKIIDGNYYATTAFADEQIIIGCVANLPQTYVFLLTKCNSYHK